MPDKTEAEQAFDALIREFIAPKLKAAGFKKAGLTWRKPTEFSTGIVHVQHSTINTRHRLEFTINLGTFFHDVQRADYPEAKWMWDKSPGHIDCHARQRIGWLAPTPNDVWWEIGGPSDIASNGAAAAQMLDKYGLPWVQRTMSDSTMPAQVIASRTPTHYRGRPLSP